jgi:hypothetical protein
MLLFGALALVLAACAGSGPEAAGPATPTATASPDGAPTPATQPSPFPTASPSPTSRSAPRADTARAESPPADPTTSDTTRSDQTAELLDELATELGRLGVDDDAVRCISAGLEAQDPEPEVLESAELDFVILLDGLAAFCNVDLLQYLEN